jgi:hypothetical protein
MPKILLTKGITYEYNARCVFGGFNGHPDVPDKPGVYDLPTDTIEAMRDDAEYFVGADAPDELPTSERRIYAAHLKRCSAALEAA